MPKQTAKSSLSGKLGQKLHESHEKHKSDDTNFGNIDLPAGINGGVAQLVDCRFSEYEKGDFKGQFFFYAAGVVVSPKTVNGVRIEGLRTSIMEPMCDTPDRTRASFDEHNAWVLNELRKLGVNTSEMGPDDYEPVAAALKEAKPYFRFHTWKGEKQTTGPFAGKEPRVQHQWQGATEYNPEEDGDAGAVVDDTTAAEPEKPAATKPATTTKPAGGKTPPKKPEPPKEEPASEEVDLAALAEAADGGDNDAALKLTALAEAAGMKTEDVEGAENWAAVATAIAGDGDNGAAAGDEASEFKPDKSDVYRYKPPRAKKAVECEVLTVNEEKKTVNLRDLDTKALYKNVPFDQLSS